MAQADTKTASMAYLSAPCPACGSYVLEPFYDVKNVPTASCLLMETRTEATGYQRGDILLAFCHDCGFVCNAAFDPGLIKYTSSYEETQGFSATFNAFHRDLAQRLMDRHRLDGKTVMEIGCGKGEFLTMLCELGAKQGIGFDPGYRPERNTSEAAKRINFVIDFYSKRYASYTADFICCKMTLEHIPNVGEFLGIISDSVAGQETTVVFFQVPEAMLILDQLGFWDVYYEHCSYFTAGSLARLFENCGFDVLNVWAGYDKQYLMIEARPKQPTAGVQSGGATDIADLARKVERFRDSCRTNIEDWRGRLQAFRAAGKRTVLWGSGSKGVSFLTTIGVTDEIACAVDINPYRQGKFMPGTGHEIVAPGTLDSLKPDNVIIMNPIYRTEITEQLASMSLSPNIMTVA
jgi:SAM-dependent methyltransferase